jgi:hypothetical protein
MPVPPGINLTKQQVQDRLRLFLGDRPEENKLIPGFELEPDKLELALDLVLDEFNNTPPFFNFTIERFPSLMILLHGGTVHCLIMAGLIQSRNYLNFNDGGISEVISDKSPQYQSWIQSISGLIGNYKQKSDELKIALNMENAFGVIPSPYGNFFDGFVGY